MAAVAFRHSGRGGQPSGIPAHDLHYGDVFVVVHRPVALDLREGGGDVLGRGTESRAVVSLGQVVVDGFGRAHDKQIVDSLRLAVLGQLEHRVHGVISANVDKIPDAVFAENLQIRSRKSDSSCSKSLQLAPAGAPRAAAGIV